MNKRFVLLVFAYWIISTNLITLLLMGVLRMFLELVGVDINSLPEVVSGYWLTFHQYIESTLFGFLFSILFLFIHQLAERKEFGRMSFGRIIMLKSALYLIGFTAIFFAIYGITTNLNPYTAESLALFAWSHSTILSLVSYLLIIVIQIVLLNFIIQSDKTFGHSTLINFLTGKYHTPVIENRVFLFIDLKDSTAYAEQLGTIKYSMLIKDCIEDLNTLINKHKAEIYQYVGDEIVVTWLVAQMAKRPYCINLFFAFTELLESRTKYYTDRFGFVPRFKAGANGGRVTATEIGDIKRDIAYHGDVLNTASRVQEACNAYKRNFLITGRLLRQIKKSSNLYETTFLGKVHLKGKQGDTDIHAVTKPELV